MWQMTANFRRDPAPSRIAYRIHRLWLTPSVRFAVKVLMPATLATVLAIWYIDGEAIKRALLGNVETVRRFVAERPEFMIRFVSIDGASDELSDRIRKILPVRFPVSTFELKLDEIQSAVESIEVVASVELHIRPGDILHIAVTEHIPVAVWRLDDALMLVSPEGRITASLSRRGERADLPLIAGEGADAAVSEALAIVAAAEPLVARLRGLVRIGERRWNVVLDGDQRIMLPETGAVVALEQVIALHQAQDLLDRDVAVIDMRNPRRPTVRMRPEAVEEMRRIRALEAGVSEQ